MVERRVRFGSLGPTGLLGPMGLLALGLLAPRHADACGGIFCDALTPMSITPGGADVLFIRDAGEIEAHVRIQYYGEPERFAWIIPLPAVPEVSVGSAPLFLALEQATIPHWRTTILEPADEGCPPASCLDVEDAPGYPTVLYDEIVGTFEVVVLDAISAASVLEFFDQNGYAYDAAAAPLIQTYLDEGAVITAVKLTSEVPVQDMIEEIHPLVFRYVGEKPCIPIRLTRVAAQDDLSVRAYFLGQHRWAPSNYAHVVLNPLGYQWGYTAWYDYWVLLSRAVDEADGHAFATEFAGDSAEVSTTDVWRPEWTAEGLDSMDAHMAIEAVHSMGFIWLESWYGPEINGHVLAALRQYLPVPQDWAEDEVLFWIDHADHPELIDAIVFDAPGFAAMLDERLFEPAMHAVDLLDSWPYLTRLHTTISPAEMTVDPTFHEVPDLPTVNDDRLAEAIDLPNAWDWNIPYEEVLGQEREFVRVCAEYSDGGSPGSADMPRARRIEQIPSVGAIEVLVDNEAEIAMWAQNNYEGSICDANDSDGDGSDGTGSDTGEGTMTDTGEDPSAVPSSRACACTSDDRDHEDQPRRLAFVVVVLALLRRRAVRERASV